MEQLEPPTSNGPDVADARPVPRRRRAITIGVGLAVLALALWFVRPSKADTPTRAEVAATVNTTVTKALDDAAKKAAAAPAKSALAYQRVLPSLVLITTDDAAASLGEGDGSPDTASTPDTAPAGAEGDAPQSDKESSSGLGTGVIINADGTILTANHVIDGASLIKVSFADGTTTTAQVASAEPERDIAVLKPDQLPEVVVPAVMGGGARVGEEAYAVGHPLGLIDSFTAGVISGLDREIPVPGGKTLTGLIQFDAAVNPGNSGGPLLNKNGQVIGIVTALANPSKQGFFVGIGFAVPIGAAAGGGAGAPPK